MKTLSLFMLVIALFASGCSTMYFHNGTKSGKQVMNQEEWHHDGILRLVEFSAPVDMASRCSKGWDTLMVEQTFVQGFVSGLTSGMYDPWNVEFGCK